MNISWLKRESGEPIKHPHFGAKIVKKKRLETQVSKEPHFGEKIVKNFWKRKFRFFN